MHVPDGWKTCSLSEVTKEKISYGIVQAGPHVEEGMPYIKSSDVGGKITVSSLQKSSKEIHYKYRRSSVHPGDIVFSLRGNIGEISIVPDSLPEANLTQGTARISVSIRHDRFFIYHQLSSERVRARINKLSKGSTFKEISLEELRKVQVLIAPIHEQQKIAQILSTWDKAIEKLEALIAAKQKRKKALMQQLLTGKKRFAGFEGEWQELNLEHIFKRITRKNTEGNTNVVTISAQKGLIKQEEFFNKTVASETLDNYFLLKQGEFAYNKSYSNGYPMGAVKRLNNFDNAVVTTLYICFAIKDNTQSCSNFFEHYFESGRLIPGLMKVANEGGRAHGLLNVTPRDFFNLKIRIPEFKEQQKIASVLTAADTEIETHQKQLAALKEQKKGLMHQLLTGKKRVKVDGYV